jgi:hypothetical protein
VRIQDFKKRAGSVPGTITPRTYAHLFDDQGDDAAADAIERMLGK